MTEICTIANATNNSFLDALERVRPEFASLSEEELLPITLDPVAAAVTMRGALPKVVAMRPTIETLSHFDIRALDKLEDYLRAWLRANALFLGSELPPEGFSALLAKVTAFHDNFLSDAHALVQRGMLAPESLATLKGTTGYKNIASDVLTLTTLLRANWQRLTGRTCVTLAELDEADAAVDALITDLGLREQTPMTKAACAVERQQAYTLFVNAYDQVRRAISYLRWDQSDVDEIVPSLFGGRRRRAATEAEPPAESATTPATGLAAVPGSVATAPAAGGTTAASAGVGLPGSDPFSN